MRRKGDFSRRQVLGKGLGAVSAVLLGAVRVRAQDTRPTTVPVDDLRCGMIGIGGRGSGLLSAVNQSPGVRVTALCDINPKHLQAAAEKVKDDRPRLFEDYRKLIEFKDLDAVVIATPVYLHAEMSVAVLNGGMHLYCEKPLGMTVKDCKAVLKAAQSAKGIYQGGTQLRYAHPWQSSIKLILSGEVGRPIFVRAHRHNVGDLPHDRQWLFEKRHCGDTIVEQAVHEFDLFNWILGGPPVRASGFGQQSLRFEPKGRDIMDNYALSLDYGKDKKVSYSHSWISAPKIPMDGRQEIVYCEEAAVDVENAMVYPRNFGEPYKVTPAEPAGDSTQLAIDDFFKCIREKRKPLAGVQTGFDGAMAAILGRQSIEDGRVVTMEELLKEG